MDIGNAALIFIEYILPGFLSQVSRNACISFKGCNEPVEIWARFEQRNLYLG